MFKEDNARIRYELLQLVEGLSDEQLNEKPDEGRWSAMEILDHVQRMEWTIARNIEKELENEESEKAMKKPIQVTVNRSVKVEAPKALVPSGKWMTLDEMKQKLDQSHNKLYEVYDSAEKDLLEEKSLPHPLFGRMPLAQWFPFVGLHEKRHIQQLEEALSHINQKTL